MGKSQAFILVTVIVLIGCGSGGSGGGGNNDVPLLMPQIVSHRLYDRVSQSGDNYCMYSDYDEMIERCPENLVDVTGDGFTGDTLSGNHFYFLILDIKNPSGNIKAVHVEASHIGQYWLSDMVEIDPDHDQVPGDPSWLWIGLNFNSDINCGAHYFDVWLETTVGLDSSLYSFYIVIKGDCNPGSPVRPSSP